MSGLLFAVVVVVVAWLVVTAIPMALIYAAGQYQRNRQEVLADE